MSTSGAPISLFSPIRFGVIGAGFIARWFAEAVDTVDDAWIVGVTSAHPKRAAAFAAEHGGYASYASLEEMLAVEGENAVDVVYVGSPNAMHAEHAITALQAGRHVLVEKPFAVTPAQARAMTAAAAKADRLLMEGWLPAFEPGIAAVRENLGRLGAVRRAILVKEQYSSRMDAYREGSLPPAFDQAMAGGSLMDLGIYPVNLAIHLFGAPDRVNATGVMLDSGVDAMGTVVLGYDAPAGADRSTGGGFEVVCLHSKTSVAGVGSAICGDHDVLVLDDCQWPRRVELRGPATDGAVGAAEGVEDLSAERSGPALGYELAAFCALVRAGARESDRHPLAHSVTAIDVLTEARRQVGVVFPADSPAGSADDGVAS